MKISVRNLEPTKVKLTVTVDPEEFNPYLDEARKEIAKQVNVPGFRKGHVPGKIIDQRIGFGAVAGEAVNNGVPELYSKALETKKIHPMAQPEIDVQDVPESAKDETKLKFVATVERRPDIELPALDGMEIEVAKAAGIPVLNGFEEIGRVGPAPAAAPDPEPQDAGSVTLHLPAFKAMAVCNQHLDHGPISIELDGSVILELADRLISDPGVHIEIGG